LAEEQAQLETLPAWVPLYLAAWGSRLDPEGKRMRVKTAAGLAGVTDSAVRELRRTNEQFRLLEAIAREASKVFLSSYMEAGIRSSVPQLLRAYLDLVEARNPQVVLQGMKWALDKQEAVNVNLRGVVATDDVSDLSDGELDDRLGELLAAFGKGEDVPDAEGEETAPGDDGP